MLFIIIGMALTFFFIGMVITERNAPYLLSGYNTLRAEDQQKVDIRSYLIVFRKFHMVLAGSFLVIELLLTYLVSDIAGGIFLIIYPILAYIYFTVSSRKYFSAIGGKRTLLSVAILVAVLLFVSAMLYMGLSESKLVVGNGTVTLTGIYGEEISSVEVTHIELIDHLPATSARTNGFALGSVRKEYFRALDGATVKLILNKNQAFYVMLTKSDDSRIYFSSKSLSNEEVFAELKSSFPDLARRGTYASSK